VIKSRKSSPHLVEIYLLGKGDLGNVDPLSISSVECCYSSKKFVFHSACSAWYAVRHFDEF
jgi:hypothetical protein